MTKAEQAKFLDDLLTDLRTYLENRLPDVPGNWDGHELRRWIADTVLNFLKGD
jgi:hypothetical protein